MKKGKKRHPQGKKKDTAYQQESEFSADGKRKRMNPTSRNLLLLCLVLLAVSQLLLDAEWIPEITANLAAGVSILLMMLSMYLQYKSTCDGSDATKNGKLR